MNLATPSPVVVPPIHLSVNIDQVAMVRNASGGVLPDPVRAAMLAAAAGADGISAYLREDRGRVRDDDMRRLRETLTIPLTIEMAPTHEMVAIAVELRPQACCLVPERREQRTPEDGLDVVAGGIDLAHRVERLSAADIRVSLFVAPDAEQILRAADIGAAVVELDTGAWCDHRTAGRLEAAAAELERLAEAAAQAAKLGLEVHAGHGLDCDTAQIVSANSHVRELTVGRFLIGEAMFEGLETAVRRMRAAMTRGRAQLRAARAA